MPMSLAKAAKEISQATDRKIAKPYEPMPDERAAMETLARKERTPRVKVAETKGKKVLSLDHPNQAYGHALLMKALATDDVDFPGEILAQLAIASMHDGKVYDRELNFMVAVVKGIQPRDQLETLLAVQMAAVHSLCMNMVCRLNGSFRLPQLEITERAVNKLARTFAAQIETLKRYRSSGEQKVTVEHVTINQGGNAIVGNVTHGGPGVSEKRETTS
jgi:hypothetical protein